MVKIIRKVGNSHALLLDKPLLELMGIREGAAVNLTLTNGSLVVTPVSPQPVTDEKFEAALDTVMRTRRNSRRS